MRKQRGSACSNEISSLEKINKKSRSKKKRGRRKSPREPCVSLFVCLSSLFIRRPSPASQRSPSHIYFTYRIFLPCWLVVVLLIWRVSGIFRLPAPHGWEDATSRPPCVWEDSASGVPCHHHFWEDSLPPASLSAGATIAYP